MGKTPLESLGIWCWIPTALTVLPLFMGGYQILVVYKGGQKVGMSYAAILLTSLPNIHDFGFSNDVMKKNKLGLFKSKSLCASKSYNKESKKVTHRMGGNVCNSYIW